MHYSFSESLSEVLNVSPYKPEMASGDRFIAVQLPGLPFDEHSLSFTNIPGSQLLQSPEEINKAYLFSQLVNRLLLVDSSLQETGSTLAAFYLDRIRNIPADSLPPEAVNSFPFTSLNSALYDAAFYLTVVNPLPIPSDSAWIQLTNEVLYLDQTVYNGKDIQLILPSYRLKAMVRTLRVERPWFDVSYVLFQPNLKPKIKSRNAYIEEVIVAKGLFLEKYGQNPVRVTLSKSGKRIEQITNFPERKIATAHPIIIGYVYRIL